MKTKSPLSYYGSDSEVASELAGMLDHCKHVTIPFCGGMAILPHLKAKAVVANDLHGGAINFYRVASDSECQQELFEKCQQTLSHPEEIEVASAIVHDTVNVSDLNRAWAFWTLCWIPRKGKGGTKDQFNAKSPSVRFNANGGSNCTRIKAVANDLEAWAKEFERCDFTQLDFRELLPKMNDKPDCGVYCDAPWVGAGDKYLHSFTEQDHRDLAEGLSRFKQTTVVIRYGDDPLIREHYPADRWEWIEAESRTQANSVRGEVWIRNRV